VGKKVISGGGRVKRKADDEVILDQVDNSLSLSLALSGPFTTSRQLRAVIMYEINRKFS
jgi:hypothetical protein